MTRCLMPVFCFCYFCISENLLLEIFSVLDENLRELFLRQDEDRVQKAASEAPHRPGAACCRGQGATRGWEPPLPVGHLSAPSDAYKITLNLKTSRQPLFSREVTPRRRTINPSSGLILKLISAPCRRGDRSRRAPYRLTFLRDDL